jgi:hypothetical protein
MALCRSLVVWAVVAIAPLATTTMSKAAAQDVSTPPVADTLALKPHVNTMAGEFTPGRGFDIFKTDWASLNISFYGLFRWLDQVPADQTFRDHLGRLRVVRPRNDPELAPLDDLAHGLLLRPQIQVQHHGVVITDESANTHLRQPGVRCGAGADTAGWCSAEPDRPLVAGYLAVLGGQRPADG